MDKATIFIVDDDEAIRDSLSLLLESAGIKRIAAHESARDFLDRAKPVPGDCLIVDVRMPDIDGLELQQALIERGVDMPVIVMSGHGDIPIAVRALKAGASDFIEKPFNDDVMLEAVQRALTRAVRNRHLMEEVATIRTRHDDLTDRERDVFQAMIAGHPNKVIAHLLSISPRTVEIHRARVMEKMQARSLSTLVRMAIEAGLSKSGGGRSKKPTGGSTKLRAIPLEEMRDDENSTVGVGPLPRFSRRQPNSRLRAQHSPRRQG
jgi:two-component system, LuxR family, response regulator FixJ